LLAKPHVLIIDTIKSQENPPLAPDIPALTAGMALGEEEAFRRFHQLYFNRLLAYLLVVTRNEETAREALQGTLLRVARHAREFDSEPVFWCWLTVLARSAAGDEGRRARRYAAFLDRFLAQQRFQPGAWEEDAEARLLELLEARIERLPEEERDLVRRKYFEGEAVRDIAARANATEKAIESRLGRIRQRLKEMVLTDLKHER